MLSSDTWIIDGDIGIENRSKKRFWHLREFENEERTTLCDEFTWIFGDREHWEVHGYKPCGKCLRIAAKRTEPVPYVFKDIINKWKRRTKLEKKK